MEDRFEERNKIFGQFNILGFRFVHLVELSSEDQYSQNTMKYSNARLTNIALLHRKLEKLVNFAGKYEIRFIKDDIN